MQTEAVPKGTDRKFIEVLKVREQEQRHRLRRRRQLPQPRRHRTAPHPTPDHPTVNGWARQGCSGAARQEATRGLKDAPAAKLDMAEQFIPWAQTGRQGWPACSRRDISLANILEPACRHRDISPAHILEIHMAHILQLHQDLDIQAQDLKQRRRGHLSQASRPS